MVEFDKKSNWQFKMKKKKKNQETKPYGPQRYDYERETKHRRPESKGRERDREKIITTKCMLNFHEQSNGNLYFRRCAPDHRMHE